MFLLLLSACDMCMTPKGAVPSVCPSLHRDKKCRLGYEKPHALSPSPSDSRTLSDVVWNGNGKSCCFETSHSLPNSYSITNPSLPPAVARPFSRGAGQVLREGAGGAAAAHADVPALERPRQLPLRPEEEEAEAGEGRRPR